MISFSFSPIFSDMVCANDCVRSSFIIIMCMYTYTEWWFAFAYVFFFLPIFYHIARYINVILGTAGENEKANKMNKHSNKE